VQSFGGARERKERTMIESIVEDEKAIRWRAREAECKIGIMVSGIDSYSEAPLFAAVLGIRIEWLLYGEEPMIANP
jgi:hypothetical protein